MTAVEEKLLAIAAEAANLSPDDVLNRIAHPGEGRGFDNDWLYKVDDDVYELWGELSLETKLIIFAKAAFDVRFYGAFSDG